LELGHNKNSCNNPKKTKESTPKNKWGRPKRGETITPIPSGEGVSRIKRKKLQVRRAMVPPESQPDSQHVAPASQPESHQESQQTRVHVSPAVSQKKVQKLLLFLYYLKQQ